MEEFCYGGSQLGCGISSRNALQYGHREQRKQMLGLSQA